MIGQVLKRSKNSLKMSSIVSMWADFFRGVLKNRQVFSKIYIVKNIVFTSFNHFLDCPLTRMVEGFPQSKRPSFRKALPDTRSGVRNGNRLRKAHRKGILQRLFPECTQKCTQIYQKSPLKDSLYNMKNVFT